jgi:hypothetical protein
MAKGYVSIGTMIKKLSGLQGTKDITEWEDEFIESIVEQSEEGKKTSHLSEKQVAVIERIHAKHFG